MDSVDFEKLTEETFNICDSLAHTDPFSYPEGPGLIFRIENMGGVFALKGFSCESINDVFQEIMNSNELKRNGISYFETDKAQLIYENLFNRRFSLYSDLIDLENNWQLVLGQGELTIYFHRTHQEAITLGPLGDKNLLPELLKDIAGVEIESNKRFCKIRLNDSSLEFCLREALLEGRSCPRLAALDQLALLRQFWLSVEKELFCKNGMLH